MAENRDGQNGNENPKPIARRYFLRVAGAATLAIGVTGWVNPDNGIPMLIKLANGQTALAVSQGYLLVDIKKCQGCVSCMLACSLVHEGVENLSMSRIQVIQSAFAKWPDDLTIEQCRQCVDPVCVSACPENAMKIDARFGNVRRVVEIDNCIGCGSCVEACPYTPSRPVLAPDEQYGGDDKARKCDLCASAAFHWDPQGGGPKGKQACVEVCPVGAVEFTTEIPEQKGNSGYQVNLRDYTWNSLGYSMK